MDAFSRLLNTMSTAKTPDKKEAGAPGDENTDAGRPLASPGVKDLESPADGTSVESRRTSGAVDAIEAALSAGTQVSTWAGKEPHGRSLPEDPDVVYNVDTNEEGETQPQLEVLPITVYQSDFVLKMRRQIAVNSNYICYALKQGHLRVLSTQSAQRALIKAHAPPLTDMQFYDGFDGLLACADSEGQVALWQLASEENGIMAERVLFINMKEMQGEGQELHFAWHPQSSSTLAVTVRDGVLMVDVDTLKAGAGTDVTCKQDELQNGLRLLHTSSHAPTSSVAFSPDGALVAAAVSDGKVSIWDTSNQSLSAPVIEIEPYEGRAVSSVTWVAPVSGGPPMILTGDALNRGLRLFRGSVTLGFSAKQTLRLESLEGEQAFYNHLVYCPASSMVVLANSRRNAVYTVHLGPGKDSALRFDYLAKFSIGYPIVSLTAAELAGSGQETVQLFCVQTQAIQQYNLQPQVCRAPSHAPLSAREHDASAASAIAGVSGPAPHPLSSEADQSGMGSPAGATPENSRFNASVPASSSISPPASMEASDLVAPESPTAQHETLPLPTPPPVTTPPAAAVPQPRLLTPKQLNKLTGSRTASLGSSASTEVHAPHPEDSQGFVQQVSSAGPPRSPPTPFLVYGTPAPASSPTPKAREVASPSVQSDTARDAAFETGNVASAETSQMRSPNGVHVGPAKILKRRKEVESIEGASDVKVSEPPVPSAEGKPEIAPVAAPSAEKPAIAALPNPLVAESSGGVNEAVLQRMEAIYKKLLAQLNAAQTNTLKGLREDMRKETKRIEAATQAQVNRLAQKQAETVEAERTALMAQQHKDLEKLIAAISASVNRDLPLRIEEMVRRELAGLAGSIAASVAASVRSVVAPACQSALAEALPRDLAGPQLQGALEKALAVQLRAALAKPLQDSFRASFQGTIIPAFEGACQTMFSQVQATFAGGLAEHLQAAGGANAAAAAALKESINRVGSVADVLSGQVSEGQRRLLQLAEDAAAAGGSRLRLQALTVSQIEARVEDPTVALKKLLEEQKYEEAFGRVLDMADVSRVTWLCQQLDPAQLLNMEPLPLSQSVLLSLMQQLGSDLSKDTGIKLQWLKEAAPVLDPNDVVLAPHMRQILQQLFSALQACQLSAAPSEARACRHVIHLVNSLLHQCH